jgi:hypothetical protein
MARIIIAVIFIVAVCAAMVLFATQCWSDGWRLLAKATAGGSVDAGAYASGAIVLIVSAVLFLLSPAWLYVSLWNGGSDVSVRDMITRADGAATAARPPRARLGKQSGQAETKAAGAGSRDWGDIIRLALVGIGGFVAIALGAIWCWSLGWDIFATGFADGAPVNGVITAAAGLGALAGAAVLLCISLAWLYGALWDDGHGSAVRQQMSGPRERAGADSAASREIGPASATGGDADSDPRTALEAAVRRARGLVSPQMAMRLNRVRTSILEALRLTDGAAAGDPDAFVVREAAWRYVPDAIEGFLALPASAPRNHSERTPEQELDHQIGVIEARVQRVIDGEEQDMVSGFEAHGRFLVDRLSPPSGSLVIPVPDAVPVRIPAGRPAVHKRLFTETGSLFRQ